MNKTSKMNWKRIRAILKWTWNTSSPYKKSIGGYTVIGLLDIITGLAFIWASKQLIDVATGARDADFWFTASLVGGILLLQLLFKGLDNWISANLNVDVNNHLRRSLFHRLLKSRWNELEQFHSGDVLMRLQQDISEIVTLLTSTLPLLIITITQLILGVAFLFVLDPVLALLVVGIVPFFFLFNRLYLEKMHGYNLDIKTNNSHIQSHIQESIQHGTIIKSYGMVGNQVHQLEVLQNNLRETILKKTKLSLLLRNIAHVGFSGGYLLAFFWGAYKLYHRSISFGTVTAFLQLVNKIQQPVAQLIRVIPTIISTISAVERVMELEALEHENCLTQERISGNITLEMNHVTFGYKDLQHVIKDFNLKLHTGDTAAIVGPTGSGKTTILRLLLGFIKPAEGNMVMRTQHGSTIQISCQTRCNFVYVPQGNALFSGSIRDNLLIGNEQATDAQLIEALHTAVAYFVFDLPAGLDTHLNEFGGGLSEGQAQRIAIARSLLHPGNIFLFDEISSALDEATEFELIRNIASYNANKINLFVTHRPAVVSICDKVFEL